MAYLNEASALNLSSPQERKATWPRTAVLIAALVEILVGRQFPLLAEWSVAIRVWSNA